MAGTPRFTGVSGIISGRMTYNAHGIAPSVATITFPPQNLPPIGTLEFVDLQTGGGVRFTDCLVDSVNIRSQQSGFVAVARIFDERWRWQNGEVLGAYNQRKPNGEVDPDYEKSPQELATLLLQAMGVARFNVFSLPNEARPEVIWEYANPAQELNRLCTDLGCRVVRLLSGEVQLLPLGVGQPLPFAPNLTPELGIDPANRPSRIRLVCGPTEWQQQYSLQAVAEEVPGGNWVPLDDVSYKPASGWQSEAPGGLWNVTSESPAPADRPDRRQLALRSVFRTYQISRSDNVTLTGIEDTLTLQEILPLNNARLDTTLNENGVEVRLPPLVKGIHYAGDPELTNTAANVDVATDWSLDVNRGIVVFSEPVFRIVNETQFEPATLTLTVSHAATDPELRMPYSEFFVVPVPGAHQSAGTLVLRRPELNRQYNGGSDNFDELAQEAAYYLQAELRKYQTELSEVLTTPGIVGVEPDGAIQQISWSCGSQEPALTTISRNNERDPYTPSYESRQQTLAAVKEQRDAIVAARREQRKRRLGFA
jgi:hypothetical protein